MIKINICNIFEMLYLIKFIPEHPEIKISSPLGRVYILCIHPNPVICDCFFFDYYYIISKFTHYK